MPKVMLGGIPIDLHAGAPAQQYASEGGSTRVRLSGGALVNMHHWRRESISVSGVGWMGAGLDGLDYTQPLELRCTAPKTVSGTGPVLTITGTPRTDFAPWAHALVGDQWHRTQVSMSGDTATCTAVPGATLYRVSWMPVFQVICDPPPEALDASNASFSWQFTAQEI